MKKTLTNLSFIILLLTRWRYSGRPINYEKIHGENLKNLDNILPARETTSHHKLLDRLLKKPFLRYVLGNIAFLKNPEKSLLKYFILEEKKIIYLRMFKNGSTAILKSILPEIHKPLQNFLLNEKEIDSLGHRIERNVLPSNYNSYKIFAIVRNPLERIVSAYLDVLSDGDYDDFLFGIFKKNMTFKEAVKLIHQIPDHLRGPHFTSQYEIIQRTGLKNIVTFKLGIENEKLKEFLASYNLSLTHANKSTLKYDYREHYDLETLELVYKIYGNDFIFFGYENEYNKLKELIIPDTMIQSS